MSALRPATFGALCALLLAACPDDGKRPLGDTCGGDGDCVSGLCAAGLCLDPAGDDDLDGITNGVEAGLGSNPLLADSDGDGVADGSEVASDLAGIDTDGDGKLDIVESRSRDVDGDCIPDQFDARDDVPDTDLSPMRDVVCKTAGICADQRTLLGVACPEGFAVCRYDRVVGYAHPEIACDEVDENCDGRVDEGFPPNCERFDWDLDGVNDTVDVCPETPDSAQRDSNADGIGDACATFYEVAFAPAPPSALTAGEPFAISGVVRRKAGESPAPMPRYRGRVDLLTVPRGGVAGAVTPVDNAFTLAGLQMVQAGTWRFVLASSLGSTESGDVVVAPAAPATMTLSAPGKVSAGVPFDVSAEVRDVFGNLADFDARATLAATDPDALLPTATAFAAGTWNLAGLTLATAGDTTLTLSAGELTADAVVRVAVGGLGALDLSVPLAARAAVPVDVTIVVRDGSGNALTDFVGTVQLSTDDARAQLPSSIGFRREHGGTRTVPVVFTDLGVRTITATLGDIVAEVTTTVSAGPPHHLVLSTPGPATTGSPQPVTVSLLDAYGHPADDPAHPYLGTVSFSVSGSLPDLAPALPGPTTFVAADLGVRTVQTTWFRQGVWKLRATGTDLAQPTAVVAIDVALSPGTTLELDAPANAKAGVPVPVSITMRDGAGNVATGFSGTVVLAGDDPRSDLPAYLPLGSDHAGTRTIQVTYGTTGAHTITASVGPLRDAAAIAVVAGAPHALALRAPGPAVVAQPHSVEVTVLDRYGNVADDPAAPYIGSVGFEVLGTQPSPYPTLPASLELTAASLGHARVDLLWFQAGTFTLAANATGLVIPRATSSVKVVLASGLELTLPASVKSGVPVDVTLRATGIEGATATGFVGTVSLRSNDSRIMLPAAITFTAANAGVRTFSATFGDAGARTITATGAGLSALGTTTVRAGAPHTLRLAVTGTATTGVIKPVRVTVLDALGQLADDPADAYTGTVLFGVSGSQPEVAPLLPGPTAFAAGDLGVRSVDTTWFRVGAYTLRATATGLANGVATTSVVVLGAPATTLTVTLPATAKAGVDVPLTVTARDANGDVATGFVGGIRLAVDESGSALPGTIELGPADAGTRTIDVQFARAGTRTVTATWQDVRATASTIVRAGAPHAILLSGDVTTIAGRTLTIGVLIVDSFGNVANDPADAYRGTVSFTANGPSPLPPDYLPTLPPSLPGPTTFHPEQGSSASFPTYWFRPGRWTLRATGTTLARGSASLEIDVSVGPATQLDILTNTKSFVVGTNPTALVRAVDAYRNTDPTFFGDAAIGGSAELVTSLSIASGIATSPLVLALTVAGDYVITADGAGLHGQIALTALPGPAYRLVASAPDEVFVENALTTHLVVRDSYSNIVKGFEGTVSVSSNIDADYVDPTPIVFTLTDEGERDFRLSFYSPGYATVDFNGTAAISPEGFASVDVAVLSNLGPSRLAFIETKRDIQVNVPYGDGFEVSLRDGEGWPTRSGSPIEVTLSLLEQTPGPTGLSGTLSATIPAGRSSVKFDDLSFDRDGRFTLRARPDVDLSGGTSERFFVTYRAPEVVIDDVSTSNGCVQIDYTVSQPDGAPVDILVIYFGVDLGFATQAASDASFQGHYQLSTNVPELKHYLWNASHDLGLGDAGVVQVAVVARAGERFIENPWGADLAASAIDLGFDRPCQPEVSAVLAAPPSPDVSPPVDQVIRRTDPLAAADVNGDGKLDLLSVVANRGVKIAYGRGDGGFEPDAQFIGTEYAGADTVAVVTGDFDGDGASDVAIGQADGAIELWLQDRSESEGFAFAGIQPAAAPVRFAAGDLDGNRLSDLVFVADDGNVTVAYSEVGGGIDTVLVAPGSSVVDLEVMDVDGRGGLDIVYYQIDVVFGDGIYFEHRVCVARSPAYEGAGARTFAAPECTYLGSSTGDELASLSVDPNPLAGARLFYTYGYPGELRVELIRFADGTGAASRSVVDNACVAANPEGLAVGTFDFWTGTLEDRTSDLATSCAFGSTSGSLDFLMMDATGNQSVWLGGVDFEDRAAFITADFTGDGADDLATARGVLATRPRVDDVEVGVRAPIYADIGQYYDENATLAADFDDDGYDEVLTALTDFDGNVTLEITSEQIYPLRDARTYVLDICTAGCAPHYDFAVLAAKGDIDGDLVPDVIFATGSDAASGRVSALRVGPNGWEVLALPPLGGVWPATLAVGDLFDDGDGRDDIAVGGYDVSGTPVLVVIHWNTPLGAYEVYTQGPSATLPERFRESFIGEFDAFHPGPELVLVDAAGPHLTSVVAAAGCSLATPACFANARARFLLVGELDEVALDGVAAGDLDADGVLELVTQARFSNAEGTLQAVLVTRLGQVEAEVQPLLLRGVTSVFPCLAGGTTDCVEPGVGPLIGDIDNDGWDDVLVGWGGGRTWEALTAESRYYFGATVSERASHAVLSDIDANGLRDVLVLEAGEGYEMWMLGQELSPPFRVLD